jgi:hypothetical protein
MELRCEDPGCDFVWWPVPNPTVKPAVEAAHRAHRGELRFDSGWYASCRCGWASPKVGQDAARVLLENHERDEITAAAKGSRS